MKRYFWAVAALAALLAVAVLKAGNRNVYPMPEERGTAGVLSALEKLPVYVRVLQTTAHPDDESAGTLTWLSRRYHARTALFSLTRGEGGQNMLGNEKYSALGLVRSGELLEACRYYGVELYFGYNVDFGFSKTAEETLSKWGHEAALADMVRFIRQWRPTIVLSQFQGNSGDGHGHHQAAGILSREAFRAAGDPNQFPEQLKQGLYPWQAMRLYVRSRAWPGSAGGGGSSARVDVPVGDYDPVLGRSWREIGSEGYSKHRTQGNGGTFALPGRAAESFELSDSAPGRKQRGDSFFDSIDTSLMAIFELAGDEKQNASFLKADLAAAQKAAVEALESFQVAHPEKSAAAVARGAAILGASLKKVEAASMSKAVREVVADALGQKLQDFQKAAASALGIRFTARTDDTTALPGEKTPVSVQFYNQGSERVVILGVSPKAQENKGTFEVPEDCLKNIRLAGGDSASCRLTFDVSPESGFTEPYWYLPGASGTRYALRPTPDPFAPFGPPEVEVEARYAYEGVELPVRATALAQAGDSLRGADFIDFQIVPELSVSLGPAIVISPAGSGTRNYEFQVAVLNAGRKGTEGRLRLAVPEKWRVEPAEMRFALSRKGETFSGRFLVHVPSEAGPGSYPVAAVASSGNREFHGGYQSLSYPENWTRNLFSRALAEVKIFDIKVAPGLTVGYIPGAGDEIPAALEQLGIRPQILTAPDLAFGDLTRFSTIITGIRAYNVNDDLAANSQQLLDYVAQGGCLIVQYVRPTGRPSNAGGGSPFPFGPYPMSVSDSERITVEDSPVLILDPKHPIFNYPNAIGSEDFNGWVQERGLYFMNSWDERYTPLLSGNDPGESAKKGGMLYARYGKGSFLYTGYSWFRQLPAGNAGAFRIFANMISMGGR